MKTIVVTNIKGGSGKTTLVRALEEVLEKAEVVDLDNQKTLTFAAQLTGRRPPIEAEKAKGHYVIYDTPPYRMESLRSLLKHADLILIPVKLSYSDLMASKAIFEETEKLNVFPKACFVFNEVKRPLNKTDRELRALFAENYPSIKCAKNFFSHLLGFRRILAEPLRGKALEETKLLVQELNL